MLNYIYINKNIMSLTDGTKYILYAIIGSIVVLLILSWIITDVKIPWGNPFGYFNENVSTQTRLAIMTALLGTAWFLCLSPSERHIRIR